MSKRKSKSEWDVIMLRHRGEFIGVVEATDEPSAKRAAIKMFRLDEVRAKQLLVRRR